MSSYIYIWNRYGNKMKQVSYKIKRDTGTQLYGTLYQSEALALLSMIWALSAFYLDVYLL